jgi:flagellar biosynthesis/type III secretory pathway chaperone
MNSSTNQTNTNTGLLVKSLKHQHAQLLHMLEILHEEHSALSSPDIKRLEQAVQNKQSQIKILEDEQSQPNKAEEILGGKISNETISAFINNNPDDQNRSEIELLWKYLQKTLNECNEQNIINNRIIDASSTHLRQAINILRGDFSKPTENIYGASGKQNSNTQGQSLAVA